MMEVSLRCGRNSVPANSPAPIQHRASIASQGNVSQGTVTKLRRLLRGPSSQYRLSRRDDWLNRFVYGDSFRGDTFMRPYLLLTCLTVLATAVVAAEHATNPIAPAEAAKKSTMPLLSKCWSNPLVVARTAI